MRKGKNTCAWVTVHTPERCGRSCMEEYCAVHRQLIRRGNPIPVPCKGCGISIQSKKQLCKRCGQNNANNRLRSIEARARKQYSLVIDQVKAGDFHLKLSVSGDICTEVPYHAKEYHGKNTHPSATKAVCRGTTNTGATQE